MKKTIFVLMISLVGCNYGSSIADSKRDTNPAASGGSTGSGGSTTSGYGGSSGTATGGTTDTASGGTTGTSSSGSGGSASGGTTGSGVGGTTTATGDSTSGSSGGAPGTGGRATGAGGGGPPDANPTGGAGGSSDAGAADARRNDAATPGTGGANGTGGAKGTGGATGTGGAAGTGGATTACVPAASGGPSGMNTGQDCVSCHGSGQSPAMTAAGTVYSTATGGSGVSGATVTITDNGGKKITMVTGSSGNFYTNSAIAFPATVVLSKCPDTQTMPTTITKGGCNSSGCHTSSMRIHLP
jgi:hypothetical protein